MTDFLGIFTISVLRCNGAKPLNVHCRLHLKAWICPYSTRNVRTKVAVSVAAKSSFIFKLQFDNRRRSEYSP